MGLAKRLRSYRSLTFFSMAEVARRSKAIAKGKGVITQGYLSRLESGKESNPSMAKIVTLSKIYGVDPNAITGWK